MHIDMTSDFVIAVLVAGGRGERAGGDGPKQWQTLCGRRVADWTVQIFADHPRVDRLVVVHHPDDESDALSLVGVDVLVAGGATRAASVQAGLDAARAFGTGFVLIHDMARPCLRPDLIDDCLDHARASGAAALALPVTDALWKGENGAVARTVPRDGLYRAQTPQCFRLDDIIAAHASADPDAADDVAVAQAAGMTVAIVRGSEDNIKITYPQDFDRAARILGQ